MDDRETRIHKMIDIRKFVIDKHMRMLTFDSVSAKMANFICDIFKLKGILIGTYKDCTHEFTRLRTDLKVCRKQYSIIVQRKQLDHTEDITILKELLSNSQSELDCRAHVLVKCSKCRCFIEITKFLIDPRCLTFNLETSHLEERTYLYNAIQKINKIEVDTECMSIYLKMRAELTIFLKEFDLIVICNEMVLEMAKKDKQINIEFKKNALNELCDYLKDDGLTFLKTTPLTKRQCDFAEKVICIENRNRILNEIKDCELEYYKMNLELCMRREKFTLRSYQHGTHSKRMILTFVKQPVSIAPQNRTYRFNNMGPHYNVRNTTRNFYFRGVPNRRYRPYPFQRIFNGTRSHFNGPQNNSFRHDPLQNSYVRRVPNRRYIPYPIQRIKHRHGQVNKNINKNSLKPMLPPKDDDVQIIESTDSNKIIIDLTDDKKHTMECENIETESKNSIKIDLIDDDKDTIESENNETECRNSNKIIDLIDDEKDKIAPENNEAESRKSNKIIDLIDNEMDTTESENNETESRKSDKVIDLINDEKDITESDDIETESRRSDKIIDLIDDEKYTTESGNTNIN